MSSGSDWLSNLISTSRLVVNTGQVIGVSHVRWAASAVLFFLESLQVSFFIQTLYMNSFANISTVTQQVKANQSSYQELAKSIVGFLAIISNNSCLILEGEARLKHVVICSAFRT
jgi:hypothetical protein